VKRITKVDDPRSFINGGREGGHARLSVLWVTSVH